MNNTHFFSRLSEGLQKTRARLVEGVASVFLGKKSVDAELFTQLESQLIEADVGVAVTQHIMQQLTNALNRNELKDSEALLHTLKTELVQILLPCEKPLTIPIGFQGTGKALAGEGEGVYTKYMTEPESREQRRQNLKGDGYIAPAHPFVILTVGVNGAGKTTTIGKLAYHLKNQGQQVLLAAGDTFRAAAVEQLEIWGERHQIPVIAPKGPADSAAIIFDAIKAAKARHSDVVIADTAGRLHTKDNLMAELTKIKRVIGKLDETAPHETLLVLDASTGQNGLNQVQEFHQSLGISGIIVTKLDGTAKGGIVFAIAQQFQLPIWFVGIGEQADDLRPFQAQAFVDALFSP